MICGIFVNITKQHAVTSAIGFSDILKGRGVEVVWENSINGVGFATLDKDALIKKSDIVAVFGGDGTILRIAKECAEYATPIFSINLGRLGFLTDYEPQEIAVAADAIINKKYVIEERKLLTVSYNGQKYVALNEAVIARGGSTRLIELKATLDNQIVDKYNADGIIISTPTGSTAYNLSAGGPIITPDVDALVLTPICPHSLHSRPVVFSDKSVVKVEFLSQDVTANLAIDGKDIVELTTGDVVKVETSTKKLLFARQAEQHFVTKLLDKLNTWGITQ